MPKKTNKSKSSNSTGLKRRFDLTNKKVQFFVVIGIVAVLGGGWFTYKSFAADPFPHLLQECTPSNCLVGTKAQKGTDSQKNNLPFYKITNNGGGVSLKGLSIPADLRYKMCVTAKADRPVTVNATTSFVSRNGGGSWWKVSATTQWADYCSDPAVGVIPEKGGTISVSNSTNTPVYISKIFVLSAAPKTNNTPPNK